MNKNTKSKSIYFVLAAVSVILILLVIYQHQEKTKYEDALSYRITKEVEDLRGYLRSSDEIYAEILLSKNLTQDTANNLMQLNSEIQKLVMDHITLAYQLGIDVSEDTIQNSQIIQNVYKVSLLFDEAESGHLGSDMERSVSMIKQMNQGWLSSLSDLHDYDVSSPIWYDNFSKMEDSTVNFLKEQNLNNIEELWLQRSDID